MESIAARPPGSAANQVRGKQCVQTQTRRSELVRQTRPGRASSGLRPPCRGNGDPADDPATATGALAAIARAHRRMAAHRTERRASCHDECAARPERDALRRHHRRDAVRRGVAAGRVRPQPGRGSGMWSTPSWRCAVTSPALLSRCSRRVRGSRSPARPPSCGSASRSTRCRSTRRRNSSRSCTWCFATCGTSRSTSTASSRWHGRSPPSCAERVHPGMALRPTCRTRRD